MSWFASVRSKISATVLVSLLLNSTLYAAPAVTYISLGVGTGGNYCAIGEGSINASSNPNWQLIPSNFSKAAVNTGDVIMRRTLTIDYKFNTAILLAIQSVNSALALSLSLRVPPVSIQATGWYEGFIPALLNTAPQPLAQLSLNGQTRAVALRTYHTTTPTLAFSAVKYRGFGPTQSIVQLDSSNLSINNPNTFTTTWVQEIVLDDKNLYSAGTPTSTGTIIMAFEDALIPLLPSLVTSVGASLICVPTQPHPTSIGLLRPYAAPAPVLPPFTIPSCTVTVDSPSLVNLDPTNSVAIANLAVNQAASTGKNFNISLDCEPSASVKMAFTDVNYPAGGNNYLLNNALAAGYPTIATGVGVQVQYLGSPTTNLLFSNDSTAGNINTVTGTIITPTIPAAVTLAGGRVDIPFNARYFRYANGISTGSVASEMNVLFFYN